MRSSLIFMLFLSTGFLPATAQVQNRIEIHDRQVFLSGGNVAWVRFARDIGPGETSLDTFDEIFREVSEAGGNAMRLWLHTNGTNTPEWTGPEVTGPGPGAIEDLYNILELAFFHDIGLQLTLWSFDMLHRHGEQEGLGRIRLDRNQALLTDETSLQAYIDNALIPMVDSLKSHPALISWEIFNEPEGMSREFGWDETRHVPMADIQRFINRTAGAVKRTDPDAKVTSGALSFLTQTDILSDRNPAYMNYYRDDRLIAAGGDPLGTLDYYSVHFYEWAGTGLSPFHHDVVHWQLDKPVVIGEFDATDTFGVSAGDLSRVLFERGYAGGLAWSWFSSVTPGSWRQALENMNSLRGLHPEDIVLELPGIKLIFTAFPETIRPGRESRLSWKSRGGAGAELDGIAVALSDTVTVLPFETTTYLLEVTDADGASRAKEVTVTVTELPRQAGLGLNYPNPFRSATVIPFQLASPAHVRLRIFDINGRLVSVLLEGLHPAGFHEQVFDAGHLAAGVYLYHLEAGDFRQTRKMVLIK